MKYDDWFFHQPNTQIRQLINFIIPEREKQPYGKAADIVNV